MAVSRAVAAESLAPEAKAAGAYGNEVDAVNWTLTRQLNKDIAYSEFFIIYLISVSIYFFGVQHMVDRLHGDTISQVERNYQAFEQMLPELLPTQLGKLAVLHNGELVDFFDTYADAVRYGEEKFGEIGNFSVQEVTNRVASLGYYSYAGRNIPQ